MTFFLTEPLNAPRKFLVFLITQIWIVYKPLNLLCKIYHWIIVSRKKRKYVRKFLHEDITSLLGSRVQFHPGKRQTLPVFLERNKLWGGGLGDFYLVNGANNMNKTRDFTEGRSPLGNIVISSFIWDVCLYPIDHIYRTFNYFLYLVELQK